jgi:hypothetical protein
MADVLTLTNQLLEQVDLEKVVRRFHEIEGPGSVQYVEKLRGFLKILVGRVLERPRGHYVSTGGVFVSLDEEGLLKASFQKGIVDYGTGMGSPGIMEGVRGGVELADWMVEKLKAAYAIEETGDSKEWFDMDGKSYFLHRIKYDFETYVSIYEIVCTASVRI